MEDHVTNMRLIFTGCLHDVYKVNASWWVHVHHSASSSAKQFEVCL